MGAIPAGRDLEASGGTGRRLELLCRAMVWTAVLGSAIAAYVVARHIYEDALITVRYAENLVAGKGFVFNEGERVLGTTTPLYTLLLAVVGFIGRPRELVTTAIVLSMTFGLLTIEVSYRALRRFGIPIVPAWLAVCAYGLSARAVIISGSGMETTLVTLLMAGGAWSIAARRWVLLGVCNGLLMLTRIDGVVWTGVTMGWLLWTDRRALPIAVLVSVVVVAPWLVFAHAYFGSAIPQSVKAKRLIAEGGIPVLGVQRLALWASRMLGGIGGSRRDFLSVGWVAVLAGSIYTAVVRRQWTLLALTAGFVGAYGLFLLVGNAPLSFTWYFIPVRWAAFTLSAAGFLWIVERVQALRVTRGLATFRLAASLLLVGFFALQVPGVRAEIDEVRRNKENEVATRQALGEWLRQNTRPDALVAMEAIGFQGYYSQRKVIDLAGLVSPSVTSIRAVNPDSASCLAEILRRLEPDAIVLRRFEIRENQHFHGGPLFKTSAQRESFFAHYQEARSFGAPHIDLWGRLSEVVVFVKRPAG
jgi:hypothetical protein